MGKYKSLLSNTLLFGISSFGSKILSLLMTFVMTHLLDSGAYSDANIIVEICNFILPIMYLCISEAIIRFGLDKGYRKQDIYTTGILVLLIGYLVLVCLMPAIRLIPQIKGYTYLVYLFVFTSAMRTVTTHFVRACGYVRVFAIDGAVTTVLTIGMNLLLLIKFKMGVQGFVLSTVIADGFSALWQTLLLKLYRGFRPRQLDVETSKTMLRYSIPLVPTAVLWWVINVSDHFFVQAMIGDEANGVYMLAGRIPMIINLVSTIFTQAWQISAFTEYNSKEGERFYSTVFKSYYTFVFLAASGIIILVRPFMGMMGEGFRDAWLYVPMLLLATTFSCLVTFLGTVFNAAKENGFLLVTAVIGAILNIILNYIFIPKIGPQGAAIATFISFFAIFVFRAVGVQRIMHIRMQPLRLLMNLCLLLIQSWVCIKQVPYGVIWQIVVICLLVLCNLGYIINLFKKVLQTSRRV